MIKEITVPRGKTFYRSQEKMNELFIDLIKRYALEATEGYINTYGAQMGLNGLVRVKMEPTDSLRTIKYRESNGTLYLPEFFFKRKLDTVEDVLKMIDEYPILKELLGAYGTYIIANRPFYRASEQDYKIKELISFYLARKANSANREEVQYAGKHFCSSGNIFVLEHNLFEEIEIIFGEKALATALRYGIYNFGYKVKSITADKVIIPECQKLMEGIIKLSELTAKEEEALIRESIDESIKQKIIVPMYGRLGEEEAHIQRDAAKMLSYQDFSWNKVGKFCGHDFRNLIYLTDEEREAVKLYILNFNMFFYDLQPYLSTTFPPVTPKKEFMGAKTYGDIDERFTDINRILTMMNMTAHKKDVLDTEILSLWNKLQLFLIQRALPSSIDIYSKIRINDNLERLELLSTYYKGPESTKAEPHKTIKFIAKTEKQLRN